MVGMVIVIGGTTTQFLHLIESLKACIKLRLPLSATVIIIIAPHSQYNCWKRIGEFV